MRIGSVTRDGRVAAPGTAKAKAALPWREALVEIYGSAARKVLRSLSHTRNRLTEEEIAARAERLPYNAAKAKKHVELLSRYISPAGKTILDVGCGSGDTAIGLARAGADRVVGVDMDPHRIECAQRNAEAEGVGDITRFVCADFVRGYEPREPFDCALSIASFEHVLEAERCLEKIHRSLTPGGSLLARFGPLWLSPYGAHMFDFTRLPWVHFLFPEKVVLDVRRECFRPGQAACRYEDIGGHLNRITAARFRDYALRAGFQIRKLRLNPEKDGKWRGLLMPLNSVLNATPVLRELGALTLLAVLDKPRRAPRGTCVGSFPSTQGSAG